MRKKLIIGSALSIVVLTIAVVVFYVNNGSGQGGVAKSFATALLINKDADEAYGYTGEKFRSYTTKERLAEYIDSIQKKIPSNTRIRPTTSKLLELPDNSPATIQNKFEFIAQNTVWSLDIVTYQDSGGKIYVNSYSIVLKSKVEGDN